MKVALFNDFQLGVVKENRIYDVGRLLFGESFSGVCPMLEFIRGYEQYRERLEARLDQAPSYSLDSVRLRQPVSRPGKIVAAPVNYMSHKKEMNVKHTARTLGFFLKASTSLIGPGDSIVLPRIKAGRRFDHELELAFVIGKKAKNVKAEQAADYIFGYTGLIDVTLRPDAEHEEERCLRKSFDTFTPLGPWIVTGDEIGNPDDLDMRLTVNGEVRQQANTKDMVVGIFELVEIYSHVMTLEPGDVIATGTPEGVGPIRAGDVVRIELEGIGAFSNPVRSE